MVIRSTLTVLYSAIFVANLVAAEATTNSATMTVNGQRVQFRHFVAWKGDSYGEARICILATGSKLPADRMKQVCEKDPEDNNDVEVSQPYLKAVFTEAGEIRCVVGRTQMASFLSRGETMVGKMTLMDGRLRGNVSFDNKDGFDKAGTMNFDVPLNAAPNEAESASEPIGPPVKPSVSGDFVGNDKKAKLAFVSAHHHEEFNDKPAITLVFTEKDHAQDANPSFKAAFGEYGSALVLSVHEDGGIFGCEVAHSAHKKSPFSSLGKIHMVEFEIDRGNVKGHVSTEEMVDTFDEKWQVDLKFAAPLPQQASGKRNGKASQRAEELADEESEEDDEPSVPPIAARDLPFPKDSTDIRYKALVQQITFKSLAKVQTVANDFSNRLKSQGWTSDGADLSTPKSAILKRQRGKASLTIMIKPATKGSQATVFTEGLDWSSKAEREDSDDDEDLDEAAIDDEDDEEIEQQVRDAVDAVLDEVFDDAN